MLQDTKDACASVLDVTSVMQCSFHPVLVSRPNVTIDETPTSALRQSAVHVMCFRAFEARGM